MAASIYDNAESYNLMTPCLLSTDYIRKTDIQIRNGGIEMVVKQFLLIMCRKNDHAYMNSHPKFMQKVFANKERHKFFINNLSRKIFRPQCMGIEEML